MRLSLCPVGQIQPFSQTSGTCQNQTGCQAAQDKKNIAVAGSAGCRTERQSRDRGIRTGGGLLAGGGRGWRQRWSRRESRSRREGRGRGGRGWHRRLDDLIELQLLNPIAAPEGITAQERTGIAKLRDRHAGVQTIGLHLPAFALTHLEQLPVPNARDVHHAQILTELPAFRREDLLGRRAGDSGGGWEEQGSQEQEEQEGFKDFQTFCPW